ncbi:dynamin-binding protein-like [Watersipora subatra]|uniref:dynamin-binding protein-like n=1 Tax=Watersipora subatra TaxID=2589382 RepID=UPI00355AE563
MVQRVEVCRVLYDFETQEPDEVSLTADTYLQVLAQVNEDWLTGYYNGRVGNFPAAFVQQLPVVTLPTHGKVFVATDTFPELQAGDLAINPGEIIVGLEAVNADWWRGHLNGKVGIFPLTHAEEIPLKSDQASPTSAAVGILINNLSHNEPVLYRVRAVIGSNAQLDDELSFIAGDIIHVIGEEDSDWLIGTCNGEKGMFLRDLTELVDGPPAVSDISATVGVDTTMQVSTACSSSDSVIGKVLFDFHAECSTELSLVQGQLVSNIRQVDGDWSEGSYAGQTGIFPSAYVEMVDPGPTECGTTSFSTGDFMVLCDFRAETTDELNLSEGEQVVLVCEDVGGWSRVRTWVGQEGLCPSSFLQEYKASDVKLNGFGLEKVKERGQAQLSSTALDGVISAELEKAKSDSKRKSLHRQKPAKPSPPRLSTQVANGETPSTVKQFNQSRLSTSIESYPLASKSETHNIEKVSLRGSKKKPARPLSPAQPQSKLNSSESPQPTPYDSLAEHPESPQPTPYDSLKEHPESPQPTPYDSLKEPFESKLEWRDENPAPLIRRSSAKKTLPAKPLPPKRATGSSLVLSSDDQPMKSSDISTLANAQPMKLSETTESINNHSIETVNQRHAEDKNSLAQEKTENSSISEGVRQALNMPETEAISTIAMPPVSEEKGTDGSVKEGIEAPDTDSVTAQVLTQAASADPSPTQLARSKPAPTRPAPSRPAPTKPAPSRPAPTRPPPSQPVPSRPEPIQPEPSQPALNNVAPSRPPPSRPAPSRPAPNRPVSISSKDGTSETVVSEKAAPSPAVPARPVSSKPVPTRPAPPPPVVQLQYDEHAANHLRERIQLLERDIENYNNEVENFTGSTEDFEETLKFYVENINGMTLEVDEMKGQLEAMEAVKRQTEKVDHNSAENKEKRRVKRINKVEELIKTEEFYLRDLRLCLQAFTSPSGLEAPEDVDRDTLFYNIPDVIRLSERLLSALKSSVQSDFDSQLIGKPFIELKEEMKEVYALYCKNYDEVTSLLEQYKGIKEIQAYFNQGLELIAKGRPEKPFTVEAFLITPVQRIPRYIMLLMELSEATESSHPDKADLLEARAAQEEVADYTNEFKRRTDIVNKYIGKEKEEEDVLSRFNMHSIRKYKNRVSQRINNTLGFSLQHVDKEFDKHVEFFREIETSIRDFIKNLDNILSHLRSTHDVREAVATDISEYLSTAHREEVEKYLAAQQKMSAAAFKAFKNDIEASVQSRLLKLLALFQGPNKLIMKRADKRLDFDSAQGRFEKYKDDRASKEDLEKARKDFEALNVQLKEELPKFNALVYDIFRDAISQFTSLYQAYYRESYGSVLPILQVSSITFTTSSAKAVQQFEKRYITASQMLNIISAPKSKKLTDSHNARKTSVTSVAQTTEMRNRLTRNYLSTKLYQATSEHIASEPMELKLHGGDLVGVIQQKDPMGSEERWFVDNGVDQGFVKKTVLQPFSDEPDSLPAKQPVASVTSEPVHTHQSGRQLQTASTPLSVDNPTALEKPPLEKEQPNSPPPPYQEKPHEVYKAMYDFPRRNDNELSLTANQIIHVYQKHDEHGNTEWWYAETNAGFGYVPANYLAPYTKS